MSQAAAYPRPALEHDAASPPGSPPRHAPRSHSPQRPAPSRSTSSTTAGCSRTPGRRPPTISSAGSSRSSALAVAIAFYARVRAGARATIALLGGFFARLSSTEAVHYTRAVGASGDDYTGLLAIPAGLAAARRRRRDAVDVTPSRRLALVALPAAAASRRRRRRRGRSSCCCPISIALRRHARARAHVPAADLGAPYEDVEFTTSDGLRSRAGTSASRNGAAVIAFPGRASLAGAGEDARRGTATACCSSTAAARARARATRTCSAGRASATSTRRSRSCSTRPDVDPERIGAIGLSVGGEMMIEAAAESTR